MKKCTDSIVKSGDYNNSLCGRKKLFVFSLVMRNIFLQLLVCSFLIFLVLLFTNKVTPTTYYGNNALYSLLSTIKKHLCCYTVHLKFKMKHIWSELRSRLENRWKWYSKITNRIYMYAHAITWFFYIWCKNIILTWLKYRIYKNIFLLKYFQTAGTKRKSFINFSMLFDSRQ